MLFTLLHIFLLQDQKYLSIVDNRQTDICCKRKNDNVEEEDTV